MMIMVPPKCHSSDYDENGNADCFMLGGPTRTHTLMHAQAHARTHTRRLMLFNATIGFSFMFCGFFPLSLCMRITSR